jgi:Tol biopolymer transport system component
LNQASDIFLSDLDAATTQILSQRHAALPAVTAAAMSTGSPKCISADGKHLVFSSNDSNLVPDDEDKYPDLFVRDLSSGGIVRLKSDIRDGSLFGTESAISAGGRYLVVGAIYSFLFPQTAPMENIIRYDLETGTNVVVKTGNLSAPAISSDGNLIAYHSTNGDFNVYRQDMTSGTNKLVSKSLLADRGGTGYSVNPLFSPDDHWLVFASTAFDLVTNVLDGKTAYLFARDLHSDTTRLISVGFDGISPVAYSRGAVFSADSRHLAFVDTNDYVQLYDFCTGRSTLVCTDCANPSISADGRIVVYETPISGGFQRDIIVKDLFSGVTNLISVNRLGTGGANGSSSSPLLSWDGRFVVYSSKASDLVDNDTNGVSDIFVRDRVLGNTILISLNVTGSGSGNGTSSKPLLAADGRTVVFQSFASDLVPRDYNDRRDVFVLRLGGADTDGDGMDDDWEIAYFGTLARDGSGDFDGDGQTDRQEFLAGTDPTNNGSILRVITLGLAGGGGIRVIWTATPGKSYQVQFKENVEDPLWNSLPGKVVANGTTASEMDDSTGPASHRFYRAVLAQ